MITTSFSIHIGHRLTKKQSKPGYETLRLTIIANKSDIFTVCDQTCVCLGEGGGGCSLRAAKWVGVVVQVGILMKGHA